MQGVYKILGEGSYMPDVGVCEKRGLAFVAQELEVGGGTAGTGLVIIHLRILPASDAPDSEG
jgi:hypothetical protein